MQKFYKLFCFMAFCLFMSVSQNLLGQPENDECVNAIDISAAFTGDCGDFTYNGPFDTTGSTSNESDPPEPGENATGSTQPTGPSCPDETDPNLFGDDSEVYENSVWYTFIVPDLYGDGSPVKYSIWTSDGTFGDDCGLNPNNIIGTPPDVADTQVAIYNGPDCPTIDNTGPCDHYAANEDLFSVPPWISGWLALEFIPGERYYMAVDGWNGNIDQGEFCLTVVVCGVEDGDGECAPVEDYCSSADCRIDVECPAGNISPLSYNPASGNYGFNDEGNIFYCSEWVNGYSSENIYLAFGAPRWTPCGSTEEVDSIDLILDNGQFVDTRTTFDIRDLGSGTYRMRTGAIGYIELTPADFAVGSITIEGPTVSDGVGNDCQKTVTLNFADFPTASSPFCELECFAGAIEEALLSDTLSVCVNTPFDISTNGMERLDIACGEEGSGSSYQFYWRLLADTYNNGDLALVNDWKPLGPNPEIDPATFFIDEAGTVPPYFTAGDPLSPTNYYSGASMRIAIQGAAICTDADGNPVDTDGFCVAINENDRTVIWIDYYPEGDMNCASCAGVVDCDGVCDGPAGAGTDCGDGGTYDENCDCIVPVPGCIDMEACNFDELATVDDGSCMSNDCLGECGGAATAGTDCMTDGGEMGMYNEACECVAEPVIGCMDATACNFDAAANVEGPCNLPDCDGACDGENTGAAVAGAACDDGNPDTTGDVLDAECGCAGTLVEVNSDECATAPDISAFFTEECEVSTPFDHTGATIATVEPPHPECFNDEEYDGTTWYKFTLDDGINGGQETGFSISTGAFEDCGTTNPLGGGSVDTQIAIYDELAGGGCPDGSSIPLECNDDVNPFLPLAPAVSSLEVNLTPGNTYYIMVETFNTVLDGEFCFYIAPTSKPSCVDCGDGSCTAVFEEDFSTCPTDCPCVADFLANDIDLDSAPIAGIPVLTDNFLALCPSVVGASGDGLYIPLTFSTDNIPAENDGTIPGSTLSTSVGTIYQYLIGGAPALPASAEGTKSTFLVYLSADEVVAGASPVVTFVDQTGTCTITKTLDANLAVDCGPVCSATSSTLALVGGGTATSICVNDGVDEPVDVTIASPGSGDNSMYVITDLPGNVLALPGDPPFTLDGAGEGECAIWMLNWCGDLSQELVEGVNVPEIVTASDAAAISNSIIVTRNTCAEGCTDATACNYDADAVVDDGSCAETVGADCTDDMGNPGNIVEGCICTALPTGCTDMTACNFDMLAEIDDGSCAVEDCAGECGGDAVEDCAGECNGSAVEDCAGECGGTAVEDCAGECGGSATEDCAGVCGGDATEDCAGECGGSATEDCNGDCGGAAVEGAACGENGTYVDCICVEPMDIVGCMDATACNYDENANVAGDCYVEDCAGECNGTATEDCAGECNGTATEDCAGECGGVAVEGAACGTNGTYNAACECVEIDDIVGCMDATACNYDENATAPGDCYVEDCAGECNGTATEDCAGECGGTAVAGSDCGTDGTYNAACECIEEPPCTPGATCDDGDPNTNGDVYNSDCVCTGMTGGCASLGGTIGFTDGGDYSSMGFICDGETVIVDADDFLLLPGQAVCYVFHGDGEVTDGAPLQNILQFGSFFENNGMGKKEIYVTAYGARKVASTGGPDFADPCITFSNTLTITLLSPIDIQIAEDCDGDKGEFNFSITITGGLPECVPSTSFAVTGDYWSGTLSHGQSQSVGPITDAENYTVSVTDVNGCSGSVGNTVNCSKLPIELIDYTGEALQEGNMLKWITASEIENDYFTIESSTDGVEFKKMTTVKGNGTISEPVSYAYLDRAAVKGITYYRLSQTDFDGTTAKVGVIAVERGESSFNITDLYPIPTSDFINVDFIAPEQSVIDIEVYDLIGKTIATYKVTSDGANLLTLEVADYPAGVYFIALTSNDNKVTQKFVIE